MIITVVIEALRKFLEWALQLMLIVAGIIAMLNPLMVTVAFDSHMPSMGR